MGIRNLKKFITNKFGSVIKQIHISDFSGEKIGIDISTFIYKYKVIFREKWLKQFIIFICMLKKYNVHGVFIFDGVPPKEKQNEQKKRSDIKKQTKQNMNTLEHDLNEYKTNGTITELLKTTSDKFNCDNVKMFLKNDVINVGPIESYITKKRNQIVNIEKDDLETLKELFNVCGVSYIEATGEAEAFGSLLSNTREIKALLSEDTDSFAYGTDMTLFNLNISNGICECIVLNELLKEMELNKEEFLDFCILCGTDFNNNIYKVGIIKAFDLIKKYKSIDAEINKINGFSIDYKTVRNIYKTYGGQVSQKTKYWESNFDINKIENFLSTHGLKYLIQNIKDWIIQ
jgi:5'-3' exonuclease